MTPFKEKKVYLVGGPGGVGKTTIAAALGIRLAEAGHKTIVLTVDPARRLAQALGFEGFQQELQRVPLPHAKGELHATMLDTQRDFDRVIQRFASSPEQIQRIMGTPLYRAATASMGGTHEYAAMERLLEFTKDERFDRVVVDTPPTQNAVDLLSAPQRLANFMDGSVLKWFLGSQPGYLKWFSKSGKLALKLLQGIFGSDFLNQLTQFMEDLSGMHEGFRQRNLEVIELLKSPETAFLLVSNASEIRFRECQSFLETLKSFQIPLSGLILNRLERAPASERANAPEVQRLLDYYTELHDVQANWVSQFRAALPNTPTFEVEQKTQNPHDVAALSNLGDFLVL